MTIELTNNNILKYLQDQKLQPSLQKETDQVYVEMKIKEFNIPVFFLIRPESALLQIVAYLPYQLPKKTFPEVARMLHMLNKELDMPGFGMDELEQLIFYRCVIPSLDRKIDTRLLNMYLGTTRLACDTFIHAIGMIVSGTTTVDQVLNEPDKKT